MLEPREDRPVLRKVFGLYVAGRFVVVVVLRHRCFLFVSRKCEGHVVWLGPKWGQLRKTGAKMSYLQPTREPRTNKIDLFVMPVTHEVAGSSPVVPAS